jgi:beta-glucosidase
MNMFTFQKNRVLIFCVIFVLIGACSRGVMEMKSQTEKDVIPKLSRENINKVIGEMTLEEKSMLVVGTGMEIPQSFEDLFPNGNNPMDLKEEEVTPEYWAMVQRIRKYVPGSAGRTAEIPRLGIPTMVVADGPAGLRIDPTRENDTNTYYATAFPIATLLASSWDTNLLHEVGKAMGNEVLEYGVDAILGPGMNLHRNPLCGRNFEYYSEDPLVTGKMAAAMINGIQSLGVGTSVKHFVANNQETNRFSIDTIVSERALRELYLESFRIAVEEAQPWTVMSSYNKLNGLYTSENPDLIKKILRNDWGFRGYVMTDWFGGEDPVAQMKAGNDLLMPGNPSLSKEIVKAVKEGNLDERILDKNVKRILSIIIKTPRFKKYDFSEKPDLVNHAMVARKAGAEGMVLLKNDNRMLPMTDKIKSVAVFGNTSYKIITGGTGSGDVNEAYSISLTEGLSNGGYLIDEFLKTLYSDYIKEVREKQEKPERTFMAPSPIPEMEIDSQLMSNLAAKMDMALITIGRNSGEMGDRKAEPGDFYLTETENELIKTVSKKFRDKGKKTVVVLNIGGVIETTSWRDNPDAILLAWQPGQEAGNAIADVLSGNVNPSGKLTDSFPISYDDVPSAKNFPGIEFPMTPEYEKANKENPIIRKVPSEVVYEEDIYVGYRYFDTFNIPVAYEFGFGLSYTQFSYENMEISADKFMDPLKVSVDVRNIGKVAGREVVQVYLSAPANKMNKPVHELIAFGKTGMLNPRESQKMSFEIDAMSLASFDEASSSWIAEAGKYEVEIGASSIDIKHRASFELVEEQTVRKVTKALVPEREIKRLKK